MAVRFRHGECGQLFEVVQEPCPVDGRIDDDWEEVDVEDPTPPSAPDADGDPTRADAPRPTEPVVEPAPAAGPSAGASATWQCARCDRTNDLHRSECIECGDPRNIVVRITGDAGPHEVRPGGNLVLGRLRGASPAAAALAHFTNTSRQHAAVRWTSSGVPVVVDLGSSNGTWLVGGGDLRRLPAAVEHPLDGTTVVQLGNNPSGPNARITIEAPPCR